MNAKEKAMELVSKFGNYAYFSLGNNSMEREYEREDNAKQCALIAIDEKIELLLDIHLNIDCGLYVANYLDNEMKKLLEVKTEIEKL